MHVHNVILKHIGVRTRYGAELCRLLIFSLGGIEVGKINYTSYSPTSEMERTNYPYIIIALLANVNCRPLLFIYVLKIVI